MRQIIKTLLNWLAGLFKKRYQTIRVSDELPRKLRPDTVYLLGEEECLWQASFICPCGCKEVIHLNLLPDERPCWKVRLLKAKNRLTLHPSVWRKIGCKSHFWLRNGLIEWVYSH